MKKMISFIVAVAVSAAVAIPAFAEAPTTTKAADANKWTTSGSDVAYAGTVITMVAYEDDTIDVDSIQYVEQTIANEDGAYAFENYIPKDIPTTGSSYPVKIAGQMIDTRLDAGVISVDSSDTPEEDENAIAPTTTKAANANKWTTSGTNATYANKMMALIAYAGDTITVDSIQYLDQTIADENGAYTFANYIPKTLPRTASYSVKVGGETIDTPLDAGVIEPVQTTSVAVTATLEMANALESASVVVYEKDTVTEVTSATATNSGINLEIEPGSYDIVITRPGFLKYTIKNVTIADAAVALDDVSLDAGDMNADDIVNTDDLGLVIASFGKGTNDQGYEIKFNINGDNIINTDDLAAVISAFGDVATVVTLQ